MSEEIIQNIKTVLKDKKMYFCLFLLVILFFFFFLKTNENTPFTPVEKSAKVKIGSISTISLSSDEQLMGILSNDYSDPIMLHIFKADGELLFERSLEELNPHIVVSSYEMTFSPDNKYAAFSISDKEDNVKSRLVLVDLDKKEIIDLFQVIDGTKEDENILNCDSGFFNLSKEDFLNINKSFELARGVVATISVCVLNSIGKSFQE
jgi:hypothetical protein